MDGWHYPRSRLDQFEDPKLAHERRGAHWTFDAESYVEFVRELRKPVTPDSVILAPSFSHAEKDPVYDAIQVLPEHRIVLIEGLYTLLTIEPWAQASELLDEAWFIDIDEDEAELRLVRRHVESGISSNPKDARARARENDIPSELTALRSRTFDD